MSISENVGALSKLFQRVRVDPTLTRVREELERGLARLPGATELGGHIRDATKSLWFEAGRALRGARLRLHRAHRRPRHRAGAQRAAHDARDGPAGRGPRQDGQGPGLPAGRGRRRGHARRHPVRHRERQGGRQEVVRGPPNYTEVFGQALVAEAERDPRVVGHHRRDAQGHRDAAHDGPLPRAHLRRRHRRAARRRVRLRPGDRRLPAGLRDLLDLPPARLRPDRPRRRHPGPAGRLRDRPRRPGRRRRPHPPRRLRHRLPAVDPGPHRDGADGRGRAGRRCSTPPCGSTARWRSATRAAPGWACRCPSGPSRSRSAGPRCSSRASGVALVGYGFGADLARRRPTCVAEAPRRAPDGRQRALRQADRRGPHAPAGRAATS